MKAVAALILNTSVARIISPLQKVQDIKDVSVILTNMAVAQTESELREDLDR